MELQRGRTWSRSSPSKPRYRSRGQATGSGGASGKDSGDGGRREGDQRMDEAPQRTWPTVGTEAMDKTKQLDENETGWNPWETVGT